MAVACDYKRLACSNKTPTSGSGYLIFAANFGSRGDTRFQGFRASPLRPVDRLRGVKSSEVIVRALGGAPEAIAALFDFAPPPERRKNLRLAQNG